MDGVDDHPVLSDEAPALVSKPASIHELQAEGFSAISRAILYLRACVCSGFRQIYAFGSPISAESAVPVLFSSAVPEVVLHFMVELVTMVDIIQNTHAAFTSSVRPVVQIEAPCIPLPGYLLLVSEDVRFTQSLANCFVRYNHTMESVPGTAEARAMAGQQTPALILVDRRLPGWQALRQFSLFQTVPMMTIVPAGLGLTDETCISDLDYGMDSTHVYDENARLLAAKVRALLRRSAWLDKVPTVVRVGQVELDVDRCEVRVAGQANHLPAVQFKLLKRLMESPGIVLRRQELLDHIWGAGYAVETHTLDVHIFWLRRLLERDQSRRHTIATIRGVGVKFIVNQTFNETARTCGAWTSKPTIRRSRISQRRANRRLRVVQPVGRARNGLMD